MLCYVMLCHPLLYLSPLHVTSCHNMLHYLMSCYVIWYYVMSCYVMLCYVVPPLVVPQPPSCYQWILKWNCTTPWFTLAPFIYITSGGLPAILCCTIPCLFTTRSTLRCYVMLRCEMTPFVFLQNGTWSTDRWDNLYHMLWSTTHKSIKRFLRMLCSTVAEFCSEARD